MSTMWKYLAFKLALIVVAPLPRPAGYFVSRIVADTSYLLARNHRNGVTANIKHALGPYHRDAKLQYTVRNVFRNTAKNYFDLLSLPRLNPHEVNGRLRLYGWHHIEEALKRDKGVIIASAHLGNMDVGAQVLAARAGKMTILIEAINPPRVHRLAISLRQRNSLTLLPVAFSGLKGAIKALQRGEMVALACDRIIYGKGLMCNFLGEDAFMPVGAVDLAMRTGATLIPAFTVREGWDRYCFYFEPPVDIPNSLGKEEILRKKTQEVIAIMERYIRQHPEQWMVFQPIWEDGGSPLKKPTYSGFCRNEDSTSISL